LSASGHQAGIVDELSFVAALPVGQKRTACVTGHAGEVLAFLAVAEAEESPAIAVEFILDDAKGLVVDYHINVDYSVIGEVDCLLDGIGLEIQQNSADPLLTNLKIAHSSKAVAIEPTESSEIIGDAKIDPCWNEELAVFESKAKNIPVVVGLSTEGDFVEQNQAVAQLTQNETRLDL
jgi:hypothetical protein